MLGTIKMEWLLVKRRNQDCGNRSQMMLVWWRGSAPPGLFCSAGAHHVAQSQLQTAEFRMVVHAERIGDVQAVSGQQLQAVTGFLQPPTHRFESDVVTPRRR